jgi:hypothetical protein
LALIKLALAVETVVVAALGDDDGVDDELFKFNLVKLSLTTTLALYISFFCLLLLFELLSFSLLTFRPAPTPPVPAAPLFASSELIIELASFEFDNALLKLSLLRVKLGDVAFDMTPFL